MFKEWDYFLNLVNLITEKYRQVRYKIVFLARSSPHWICAHIKERDAQVIRPNIILLFCSTHLKLTQNYIKFLCYFL